MGAFLVFDIANHKSFESLERWLNDLREYTDEDSVIIVLGNKCDLEHSRAVTAEEIKLFTGTSQPRVVSL